ncbi:MAG TPA: alkaline phosphatase family protein [Vicinamibacterales bacterium]|nr:alkaline phosphatase family protein [Vicinamibacterales bacterium]
MAIASAPCGFAALSYAGQEPVTLNRLAEHVVLISIDGLRSDYYLPAAMRQARTPALDALRARGSWAEGVVGLYPSLTFPSHTSIVTGLRPVPARHRAEHEVRSGHRIERRLVLRGVRSRRRRRVW